MQTTNMTLTANETVFKFSVTSFQYSFAKNVSLTPITSLPAECTFPMETSATLTYYLQFTRISPGDYDDDIKGDSAKWCNAVWMDRVQSLANRWQAKSDGYLMEYVEPAYDGGGVGIEGGIANPHVMSIIRERVYIQQLEFAHSSGMSDTITGRLVLEVGSSRGNFKTDDALPWTTSSTTSSASSASVAAMNTRQKASDKEMYVLLTNASRTNQYILLKGRGDTDDTSYEINCIESYTVTGGPESPFESVSMVLSRKNVMTLYPDLAKAADGSTSSGGILSGTSRLIINGIGSGTYIVTKCKMSRTTYTITAYCETELIRGMPIGSDVSSTPLVTIRNILRARLQIDEGLITNCADKTNIQMNFDTSVNAWVALQMCARALNAKIFFANNSVYVIDYTKLPASSGPPCFEGFELYPQDPTDMMYQNVIESVELGNEGIDTIENMCTIRYGEGASQTASNARSMELFGTVAVDIDISDYLSSTGSASSLSQAIANTVVTYRAEPQQSIGFTVKERNPNEDGGWQSLFPIVCNVKSISSAADDVEITAYSVCGTDGGGNSVHLPQKLSLSTYERHFPAYTTEYWFGIANNVDLAQSTSQILTTIGRK